MEKTKTILVSNLPEHVHIDFIELFFENTKKYGGGTVIHVDYDETSASAIVEFETSQAVDRVLGNENIRMMGQEVRVEAYREIPQCTIEVHGPTTFIGRQNLELLQLYFENPRSKGGKVEEITFDTMRSVAFVTFESDKVAKRVTEHTNHVLKGQKLEVKLRQNPKCQSKHAHISDEVPCTIRARGLKHIPSKDMVEFYFENNRRSGGGRIKTFVLHDTDEDVADITFENEKDAKAVVERSHTINGVPVEVSMLTEMREQPVYQDRFLVERLQNTSDEIVSSSDEYVSGDTVMSVTMKCERIQARFLKMHRNEVIQEVKNMSGRYKVKLAFQDDNVVITGSKNGIARTMKKFTGVFETLKCEKHYFNKVAMRDILLGRKKEGPIADTEKETRCIILLPEENVTGMQSATVDGDIVDTDKGFLKPVLRQDLFAKKIAINKEKVKRTEEIASIEFHICSDSRANIDRCRKQLDAKLHQTYRTKKIDNYEQEQEEVSQEEDYYIYFKGISPDTKNDNLANFVELTTHGEVDSNKIIFDYSRRCALVTVSLTQKPDMRSINERIQKRGIDSERPDIYEVPTPNSIVVSSEEDISNTESLGLYFEHRKAGGADIKQDPYESDDGSCYVVEFGDPEVVKRVCRKKTPHVLNNKRLRVSPYFKCKAGAIWDSKLHSLKIPEHAVVTFQQNVLRILQRKCCQKLLDNLEKNHCKTAFTEKGLELKCTLTPNTMGFKGLAKEWEESSRRIVDSYIAENIIQRSLKSSEQVWGEMREFFKSENIKVREDVVATLDSSDFAIQLVGLIDPVKDILIELEGRQAEMEKRLNRKSETVSVGSLKLRLLDTIGFFRELEREMVDIEVHVYIGDGKVTIEGQPEDISAVRVKIFDIGNQISETKWRHGFSQDCVDFIERKLLYKISSLLQSRGFTAVWKIELRDIEVCVFEGIEASNYEVFNEDPYSFPDVGRNAMELLKSAIVEMHENIPDSIIEVFKSLEWTSFLEQMAEAHENDAEIKFKDSLGNIIIYGMKKEVDVIHKHVKHFLEENAIKSETIKSGTINVNFIKRYRKDFIERLEKKLESLKVKIELEDDTVNIMGKKEGVTEAKEKFKILSDAIQCKKYTIQNVTVKDVFRDKMEQGTIAIIERKTSCLIKLPGENDTFVEQASNVDESEDSDDGYLVPVNTRGATGSSQDVTKLRQRVGAAVGGKEESVMFEQEEMSFMEAHIYSDSKANIERCKKELEAKLGNVYTMKKIENYKELIKSLEQDEMKELDVIALANINIDAQAGVITIEGPTKQVSDVTSELQMKLLKIERKRHNATAAEELYKLVQWQYEEVTQTEFKLVPYDKMLNQKIEQSYKANKSVFEFEDDDGDIFVIDFKQLIEYRKSDDQDKLRVLRKDILKSAASALPEEWADMKDNENIKVISVPATNQTYLDISNRFLTEVKTGSYSHRLNFDPNNLKVNKIERIQNKTLYQQYQAKRKQMTEQKPNLPANMPIERELWHGTKYDAVTSIQMYGFHRCYSGDANVQPWYGEYGVYFAGNASYSARGWLSGAGAGSKGYMFLVKTLSGQLCQGQKGMRYLPPVDTKDPTILYDCAVDKLQNPLEFVIFNDTQAYPAYIITFTT